MSRESHKRRGVLRPLLFALVCAGALVAPAGASAQHSVGTHEQIAWVRRAADRFATAELAKDGAEACAVLNAPLRANRGGRTCAQRMSARFAGLLREPGERARLRSQQRAIADAVVIVHGNVASLKLAAPLLDGPNHFLWTENCWMLEG